MCLSLVVHRGLAAWVMLASCELCQRSANVFSCEFLSVSGVVLVRDHRGLPLPKWPCGFQQFEGLMLCAGSRVYAACRLSSMRLAAYRVCGLPPLRCATNPTDYLQLDQTALVAGCVASTSSHADGSLLVV